METSNKISLLEVVEEYRRIITEFRDTIVNLRDGLLEIQADFDKKCKELIKKLSC